MSNYKKKKLHCCNQTYLYLKLNNYIANNERNMWSSDHSVYCTVLRDVFIHCTGPSLS